jgi:hypothetical protein
MTLPDEVEAALVAMLKLKLEDVPDVSGLTEGDFNESDQIVTRTPAVRLFFRNEPFDHTTDQTALTYQSRQAWVVLCGAQNIRDFASERKGAMNILGRVCDALAGARLTLPSQAQRPQVVLVQSSLFQVGADGTWYMLEISVESITQFTANAN